MSTYRSILFIAIFSLFATQKATGQEGLKAYEHFGAETVSGDFNGDTFPDLAIGVTFDRDLGFEAGGVHILYGSGAGITTTDNQFFNQSHVGASPADSDLFGLVMAAGDFDGDGRSDLAIAEPQGEDYSGVIDAGVIHILYGSDNGITDVGQQYIYSFSVGISELPEIGDNFGTDLTSADFNQDGYADLVISAALNAPEQYGIPSGTVHVVPGSEAGLDKSGTFEINLDSPGLPGGEIEALFGFGLEAGDYNGDGHLDLAISAAGKDVRSGNVYIFYGTPTGLEAWTNWQELVSPYSSTFDFFGSALISGDFNGDNSDDLAVSAPGEDVVNEDGKLVEDAGVVHVFYGRATGLEHGNAIHQATPGMPDEPEENEYFGGLAKYDTFMGFPWSFKTLAAADLNDDNADDLLIGNPTELTQSGQKGSEFYVLYGSNEGVQTNKVERWHQAVPGIEGSNINEEYDMFGSSLTIADFNLDGCPDLAVGAFKNKIEHFREAGTTHVIYNDNNFGVNCLGLKSAGSQMFSQRTVGLIPGASQSARDQLEMPQDNVEDMVDKPGLSQNYPNPFNPSTEITFAVPASQHVSLVVFDLLGREVATLANQVFTAGSHTVSWDAGNLPTGMYLYRFSAGNVVETRMMTLAK